VKILSLLSLVMLCSACGYKSPNQMTQAGIVPIVSEMMPNDVNAGTASLTVTVNGSNFNSNAVVNWNGVPQRTMFLSAMQLMAAIPASTLATPGKVMVTVTNPGSSTPGGLYSGGVSAMTETSMGLTFTIN
jgi:IPT/TIG domain-containing protein